jgi:hypothetical protein
VGPLLTNTKIAYQVNISEPSISSKETGRVGAVFCSVAVQWLPVRLAPMRMELQHSCTVQPNALTALPAGLLQLVSRTVRRNIETNRFMQL